MSPTGEYYPCGYCNHEDAAREIAGLSPYELEKRGWIHISGSWLYHEREVTQSQIDTLFDMYMLNPLSELGRNIDKKIGYVMRG